MRGGATCRNHIKKSATEEPHWCERLADALVAARVSSPNDRAREVMLLLEGVMALMLIHGDRGYAKAAAPAAKTLVQKG
jgi:hypothetical protein